jgi:hypothetical protein
MHGRLLKPRLDLRRVGLPQRLPQRAVHRHADERDDVRLERRDFPLHNPPALDVFRRFQHVNARAWARHQVRHADAPLRQADVVVVRDRLGNDPGLVEQPPEAVRRPGKVMAGERRRHPGIDADEQHAHPRLDAVGEAEMFVDWFRLGHYELAV